MLNQIFSATFYHINSGKVLRIDRTFYNILAYLTFFRIEELSYSIYEKILSELDPNKIVIFLKYLFNPEVVYEWLYDEFIKLYDREYIDVLVLIKIRLKS